WSATALLRDELLDRVGSTLAEATAVEVDAAHPGRRRERNEPRRRLADLASTEAVALLRQDDDGPALGRLVGQRGELGRFGELAFRDAVDGDELARLAVAQGDGPGLVEQEHVDVACRLDRPA